MRVEELAYELPEELIAQRPLEERDGARLCVVDRAREDVRHETVRALPGLLSPALLVVNDTRVIPARLHGVKATGGKVEILLVERLSAPGRTERWVAIGRASKGLSPGTEMELAGGAIAARIDARGEHGGVEVSLEADDAIDHVLARVGEVPLPPYIRRRPEDADSERYQTVFAERPGAIAAPTAGLHLSHRLIGELEATGHRIARVTLHVGPGTFAPVKSETLEDHRMHPERYDVPEATSRAIAEARRERRAVVAVGTTVVRVLESAAADDGTVAPGSGQTTLFVCPPFRFRAVDALVTNFHLPRSTLLALVMAFGGVSLVRRAYEDAVRARYRFFSYGDAMLLR